MADKISGTVGYRAGRGLIRKRSMLDMDTDSYEETLMVGHEAKQAVEDLASTFQGEDVRIVVDVYATRHPDPLRDDAHKPIGLDDEETENATS